MRTVRFIGGLLTGLIALALAVTLFVYWFGFATDMAAVSGLGTLGYLFLWLAFGANLLLWTFVGLLRVGDDSVRAMARRSRRDRALEERTPLRVLVGSGGGGTAVAESDEAGRGGDLQELAVEEGSPQVPEEGSPQIPEEDSADSGTEAISLAVIIPAHNEEPVISGAISSAMSLFNRWDIYVVSDSSKDSTAEIAAQSGVNVLELLNNRGKAGAIEAVIEEFELTDNYDGVVILDADTELDAGYVEGARRQLTDPSVAAVAGFVVSEWKPRERTFVGRMISAYRDRLYFMLQYFLRFGQTWRYANVSFIVPGFASVYRSRALKEIDVNPKGLVIEDFNMTFEVHHKRLGRISMEPDTKAYSQDPFTLGDYYKQVSRWTLGFWQTVRRHRMWPSLFWVFLSLYILEVVLVSLLLLVTSVVGLFVLAGTVGGEPVLSLPFFGEVWTAVTAFLPLLALGIGLFIPDYMLTCLMAAIRRRPSYLLYGLLFFPIRLVDAYLTLRMIPKAWTTESDGRWSSPDRGAAK